MSGEGTLHRQYTVCPCYTGLHKSEDSCPVQQGFGIEKQASITKGPCTVDMYEVR